VAARSHKPNAGPSKPIAAAEPNPRATPAKSRKPIVELGARPGGKFDGSEAAGAAPGDVKYEAGATDHLSLGGKAKLASAAGGAKRAPRPRAPHSETESGRDWEESPGNGGDLEAGTGDVAVKPEPGTAPSPEAKAKQSSKICTASKSKSLSKPHGRAARDECNAPPLGARALPSPQPYYTPPPSEVGYDHGGGDYDDTGRETGAGSGAGASQSAGTPRAKTVADPEGSSLRPVPTTGRRRLVRTAEILSARKLAADDGCGADAASPPSRTAVKQPVRRVMDDSTEISPVAEAHEATSTQPARRRLRKTAEIETAASPATSSPEPTATPPPRSRPVPQSRAELTTTSTKVEAARSNTNSNHTGAAQGGDGTTKQPRAKKAATVHSRFVRGVGRRERDGSDDDSDAGSLGDFIAGGSGEDEESAANSGSGSEEEGAGAGSDGEAVRSPASSLDELEAVLRARRKAKASRIAGVSGGCAAPASEGVGSASASGSEQSAAEDSGSGSGESGGESAGESADGSEQSIISDEEHDADAAAGDSDSEGSLADFIER